MKGEILKHNSKHNKHTTINEHKTGVLTKAYMRSPVTSSLQNVIFMATASASSLHCLTNCLKLGLAPAHHHSTETTLSERKTKNKIKKITCDKANKAHVRTQTLVSVLVLICLLVATGCLLDAKSSPKQRLCLSLCHRAVEQQRLQKHLVCLHHQLARLLDLFWFVARVGKQCFLCVARHTTFPFGTQARQRRQTHTRHTQTHTQDTHTHTHRHTQTHTDTHRHTQTHTDTHRHTHTHRDRETETGIRWTVRSGCIYLVGWCGGTSEQAVG